MSRKYNNEKVSLILDLPAHYKLSMCSKVENSSWFVNLLNSPCLTSTSTIFVKFGVWTMPAQQAPDSQKALPHPAVTPLLVTTTRQIILKC